MADSWAPKVLVAFSVLDTKTLTGSLLDLFATIPVVVVGYHPLPEQTAPGQGRQQFENEDEAILEAYAEPFEATGTTVDTRLVYTHDTEQTITRVANEEGCTVILLPAPIEQVDRVLVSMRGEVNLERMVTFLADLLDGTRIDVNLFHATPDEAQVDEGELMLEGARQRLLDSGIEADRVSEEVVVSETPIAAIVGAASETDVVLLGESEPSLSTVVFGDVHERVAERSRTPILVVRHVADEEKMPVPGDE